MSCIDGEAVVHAVAAPTAAPDGDGPSRPFARPATLTPQELQEDFRHQLDAVCRVVEEQLRTLTRARAVARVSPSGPPESPETPPTPVRADCGAPRLLTDREAEIWLAAQFGADANAAMTEIVTLRLDGPLDMERLLAALRSVLGRHDALRGRFSPSGEAVRVDPAGTAPVRRADLAGEADPEAALCAKLHELAGLSFDPVAGPVARADLLRLGERQHVLVLSAHHIACDGWSFAALADEIAQTYRSGPERLCAFLAAARPEPGTIKDTL